LEDTGHVAEVNADKAVADLARVAEPFNNAWLEDAIGTDRMIAVAYVALSC